MIISQELDWLHHSMNQNYQKNSHNTFKCRQCRPRLKHCVHWTYNLRQEINH